MKPAGWDQMTFTAKREAAIALMNSFRGYYSLSLALSYALAAMKAVPAPRTENSNIEDVEMIREAVFDFPVEQVRLAEQTLRQHAHRPKRAARQKRQTEPKTRSAFEREQRCTRASRNEDDDLDGGEEIRLLYMGRHAWVPDTAEVRGWMAAIKAWEQGESGARMPAMPPVVREALQRADPTWQGETTAG